MKKNYLLIIFAGISLLLYLSQIPQNLYKEFTLRNMYSDIITLSRNNDCEQIYGYLLPTEKFDTPLENYVVGCSKNKIYSEEATINSIEIKGDEGYINRTINICYSEACTGDNHLEHTGLIKYFFINGKWYFSQKESGILCTRIQPYSMPPEFQRALSLIQERLGNSQYPASNMYAANNTFEQEDRSAAEGLKKIYNCLDIQYASTDEELNGAEGIFKFDNTSSIDDLKIFVSPKYQVKDDLLTAILLRHEIVHANYHATGADKSISCYQNEANAFAAELTFLRSTLNAEEKKSISSRYYTSQEARDLIDLSSAVDTYKGNFVSERTLQYVEQSPFYQKECSM
jgi:hypothetical protein